MKASRSASQFWAVADYFREAGPPWLPATAGYELSFVGDADGGKWTACIRIHAVMDGFGKASRFKSSITLWPLDVGEKTQKRLARRGWYVTVRELLGRAGYKGKWTLSPHGTFGDFWKDLAEPSAVRREARWLEKFRFPQPPESPERRPAGRTAGRGSRRKERKPRE
jgi:hypothetical protein